MEPLGKFDCLSLEERILAWWDKEHIYEEIKKAEPKDKKFFFLDGPPYTTGDVHLGTAWNKILKDMVIKYKRMQGYRVTDTPGYDTHGLPIEVVIEKKLGIKDKQEIVKFGLDNFIKECRTFAESKIGDMNDQFKRLGCVFWNWDNPYVTLTNTYIQGIWWTLKRAWENGYLYKFYKPQNCCPRCATALAKHEFEYETIKDTAIYVKFQSVDDPKTYFLIWTTTPWTLVSNTNIMVNPDNEYVKMRVKDEYWIMGIAATADLLQNKLNLPLNKPEGFSYGERFTGYDLEGKRYIHPLAEEVPYQAELEKQQPKVHTIVLSREYVKEGEGVGMVHTAPGHGPEDFEVGVKNGIPIFNPVDIEGHYTELGGKFEGKYVHTANREIIDLLKEKGTLVFEEQIEHEYAHCWRCKTKLVYRATEQWFFKTSALRDKMLKENEEIFWIPKYAGETNFKSWLSNLQDWCISRQRFWGIPLSIWECDNPDCDNMEVIGSKDELIEKAGSCPDDLHRPHIDKVTWSCSKCNKGTMRRIPDILDVWLDSGSVMWASQYFVDGHEHYDTWEPADFILEGKDQIRGWFNSLLCSAMVSTEKRNYNACYMHGWIMSHGVKMSKSLGNSMTPADVIEGKVEILTEKQKEELRKLAVMEKTSKFDKTKEFKPTKIAKRKKKFIKDDKRWSNVKGIENFRFYSVMGTSPGRDLNFDYKEYTDTFKVLNTFWNSYLFTEEKLKLNGVDPSKIKIDNKTLRPEDKWILSKINTLIEKVTELFDRYELPSIPAQLQKFIQDDLSRWYITLIRDRVDVIYKEADKEQALATLWYVLYRLLLLMAPINPMITEEIYQKMFKPEMKNAKKSIHLESWPKVDDKLKDKDLEKLMSYIREIIDEVRSLKTENKIKLRWPTKSLYIIPKESTPEIPVGFQKLIKEMSNVKQMTILENKDKELDDKITKDPKTYLISERSSFKIILDISDSVELQQERILRDLLRTLQTLRKRAGLQTGDPISMTLSSSNDFIIKALETHKNTIKTKVAAEPLNIQNDEPAEKYEVHHVFYLCGNNSCYAMIREKAAEKIISGKAGKCSYCDHSLTKENLLSITIDFSK